MMESLDWRNVERIIPVKTSSKKLLRKNQTFVSTRVVNDQTKKPGCGASYAFAVSSLLEAIF